MSWYGYALLTVAVTGFAGFVGYAIPVLSQDERRLIAQEGALASACYQDVPDAQCPHLRIRAASRE